MTSYRIGTRASPLARAQALHVCASMKRQLGLTGQLVNVSSRGDEQLDIQLNGASTPGLFTRALERALENCEVDLAVHSLKDLPLEQPADLPLVAVPSREAVGDLLLVRQSHHDPSRAGLPLVPCCRVGTSAPRRQVFLTSLVPRAIPVDLRGNVGTRLRKLSEGWVDALLMARAPFERLEDLTLPEEVVKVELDLDQWPCAPGQGALAIQCRAQEQLTDRLGELDHPETRQAVTVERALLAALGGGCGLPLGVYVKPLEGGIWHLTAAMAGADWRRQTRPTLARVSLEGHAPLELARRAAVELKGQLEGAPPEPTAGPDPTPRSQTPGTDAHGPAELPPGWLVAGTLRTATKYAKALTVAGLRVAPLPLVEVEQLFPEGVPLPAELVSRWRAARWVLVSSARTVPTLTRLRCEHPRNDLQVGAVSRATALALRREGFPVHLVSPSATGASLAGELIRLKGRAAAPVLVPGAAEPSPEGPMMLEEAGLEFTSWACYRSRPAKDQIPEPLAPPLEGVVLLSASSVKALKTRELEPDLLYVALGPTTASALDKAGRPCHGVAEEPSPEGILQVIQSV